MFDDAELSKDGNQVAFVTNENGISKLYVLSTATKKFTSTNLPSV